MKQTIRVLNNRKGPAEVLTVSHLHGLFKKLKSDTTLLKLFPDTNLEYEDIDKRLATGECKGCALNNELNFIPKFVRELKTIDDESKKAAVFNVLDGKVWVTHKEFWINLLTNEVEKHLYVNKEIEIPDPKKSSLIPPEALTSSTTPVTTPQVASKDVRKVIFKNFQAPGDIVMMTAAIRDLHMNHPGKFVTDVRTNSMSIWENNPYITKMRENDPGVESYSTEYPLIHQSNQGPYHFSEGFTEHFEDLLDIRIKNRIGRGQIIMSSQEEGWGNTERGTWFKEFGYQQDVHYWILNAGYKNDFTAKMWPAHRYQSVVDHFKGRIAFVQIGHKDHNHPNLKGVINLVGKTDDRQLIRLVWASSGVLTPCSYPMTLAAAVPVRPGTCNGHLDRPCVIVAGGREPSGWQAYTNHQFIHTCGTLPCCSNGGCWISRVKPIGDGDEKDRKNLCQHVVKTKDGDEIPYCMDMISSDEVIRRIELYYSFYSPDRQPTHTYNKR